MRNKRKTPRKSPAERIEVVDVNSGDIIGCLANISSGGLMLVGAASIAPGTLFQLQISLPTPVDGTQTVEFGVECLWCQQAKGRRNYWSGMQIIDISAPAVDVIGRLVEGWREHG
ncbi:MAG TPA: PilZ domain-containing protein [Sedimenticola sp.]|nr:PilZ domain-containing protein [Sedimenticola sp.]